MEPAGLVKNTERPPTVPTTCGNGIREHPEECDQTDFGFYTCANVQTRGYELIHCTCTSNYLISCK